MEVVILVDLQNDFLPGGALAVPGGDEILDLAAKLAQHFPLVVATQDWHPPDHLSFAENHPGRRIGEVIELAGMTQVLWPRHCVQETAGAELAAALAAAPITRIFRKGTDPRIDSYSGFFDNLRKRSTGLGDFLRRRGVTDVYIAGLATDYCVKATALDARQLGFKTFLVADACRGVNLNAGDIERAMTEMGQAGVVVTSSDAVLQQRARSGELQVVAEGRHLRLVRRGRWEFVQRRCRSDVVLIAAITDDGKLVFVQQDRPPVGAPVIELPAGLVSDEPSAADESLEDAARRELLEETGYAAALWRPVFAGPSSAGLTDEMVTLFVATGLQKQGPGGGVADESLTLFEIPLTEAFTWLDERRAQGLLVDARVPAGVYLAGKCVGRW